LERNLPIIASLLPLAAQLLPASLDDRASHSLAVECHICADHISVHVADIEKSSEFYRSTIGLREIRSPVPSLKWFDAGRGVQIHLVPGRREAVQDNRPTHLAFAVPEFDDFLANLHAHGIPWWNFAGEEGAVSHRADGARQIYIRDPDGYWIELNDSQNLRARSKEIGSRRLSLRWCAPHILCEIQKNTDHPRMI